MSENKGVKSYENYVCPDCWRPLGECQSDILPYKLLYIDKGIQEHVRVLNSKGYHTIGCCEGHVGRSTTHVFFSKDYKLGDYIPIPKGFNVSRKGCCLSSDISRTPKDKRNDLAELLRWCYEIPMLKDCQYDHEDDYLE